MHIQQHLPLKDTEVRHSCMYYRPEPMRALNIIGAYMQVHICAYKI